MLRPLLAVTMGDPVGVGPEVILKAASVAQVRQLADLVVVGDAGALSQAARDTATQVEAIVVSKPADAREIRDPERIAILVSSDVGQITWGEPSAATDAAQVAYVQKAFDLVASEAADGIVTAPIHKKSLKRAGVAFPGHTEMLAALSDARWPNDAPRRPVMMLAGPSLKVVPITTHVALSEVPSLITEARVRYTIGVVDSAFRKHFQGRSPRIGVAGLNPHAGEGGLFGNEDVAQIAPAIESARAEGVDASGPYPPDTVFQRALQGEFDVVLGMYHDQALIPLKLMDFDHAVNVTLGLPIIRTSVDHGTAYDIAGAGVASAHSMIEAIRMAATMVVGRNS